MKFIIDQQPEREAMDKRSRMVTVRRHRFEQSIECPGIFFSSSFPTLKRDILSRTSCSFLPELLFFNLICSDERKDEQSTVFPTLFAPSINTLKK